MRRLSFQAILLSSLLLAPLTTWAQPPLTEDGAIRQALAHHRLLNAQDDSPDIDDGEALEERLWPDPEFVFEREHLFGGAENSEIKNVFAIEQELILSGRTNLIARAQRLEDKAEETRESLQEAQLIASVRALFFETLEAQMRAALYQDLLEDYGKNLLDLIQSCVNRDECPEYEYDRRLLLIAQWQSEQALQEIATDEGLRRLTALLGTPISQLEGALLPDKLPQESELQELFNAHPEQSALNSELEAAKLRLKAAQRWWVPQPALRVGYQGVQVDEGYFHGYDVELGLSLPLWSRGRPERLEALATIAEKENDAALLQSTLHEEVRSLARQAQRLHEVAHHFATNALPSAQRTLDFIKTADSHDELSPLDLFDALQDLLAAQLHLLDLRSAARQKELEFRSAGVPARKKN